MLKEFLAIIERLIALKEGRELRAAGRFKEVYKPAFEDLLVVHLDYVNLFCGVVNILDGEGEAALQSLNAEQDWRSHGEAVVRALDYLKSRRLEFEPHRVKLRSVCDQLGELDLGDADTEFVNTLRRYFYPIEALGGKFDNGLRIPLTSASVSRTAELDLEVLATLFKSAEDPESYLIEHLSEQSLSNVADEPLVSRLSIQVFHFRREIEHCIRELRSRWASVTEAYATLQIASNRNIR